METFDGISCKLPPSPILKQFHESLPDNLQCNYYENSFKKCFYVIELQLDEVINIIFQDVTHKDLPKEQKKDKILSYDRSIHFHGHSVLLLKQGTLEDFKKQYTAQDYFTEETLSQRIFKDTVGLPKDGYIIVRLHATNPGIWALETPLSDSNSEGIALAFLVGDKDFKKSGIYLPRDFPDCDNYVFPVQRLDESAEEERNEEEIVNEQHQVESSQESIELVGGSSQFSTRSTDKSYRENGVEMSPTEGNNGQSQFSTRSTDKSYRENGVEMSPTEGNNGQSQFSTQSTDKSYRENGVEMSPTEGNNGQSQFFFQSTDKSNVRNGAEMYSIGENNEQNQPYPHRSVFKNPLNEPTSQLFDKNQHSKTVST
ncbi:hypothetical protein V9T40_010018 [Parthenolecanium corni]|uniref:Plastocyanin-like domain-containing protein n=1 Tax=Parthenolecanium corni TaxID=536013 RepID=A0AAN9TM08_9HEMI